MNILFISRAFPPVIGGIERQNIEIAGALSDVCDVELIVNRWGKRLLPLFLPYATVKALLIHRKYEVIVLGDGVLGITGYILQLVIRKPVICIVHGLDLTYQNRIYQKLWVNFFLSHIDRLIAVGNETMQQGILRGIPASRFTFIPNGVSVHKSKPKYSRKDLESFAGRRIEGSVLLTLGRLVKRKGIGWFIENVIGRLDANISYIIAGQGPEKTAILTAIKEKGVQERVLYVGGVSEHEKQLLYATADIFIQPNIEVPGDIEGFGLVVLEAAANGLVVVASRLEGLRDAIQDGKNGFLVDPLNPGEFAAKIESILSNRETKEAFGNQAKAFVENNYSWHSIAERYLEVLSEIKPDSCINNC